ncbi:putative pectinesterase/pectinesterase inhibitor 51 [Curcuma longa]|uniref:putative pectinesterase/pectinesterase inhibitor 51 n=1 Tax=Curcuma longa TaxID=136217 RepID=UPI003D9EA3F5
MKKLHRTPRPSFLLAVAMAALFSLTLLFLLLLPSSLPFPGAAQPSAVRLACRATRFASSCLDALSLSSDLQSSPSSLDLLRAALLAPIDALPSVRSQAASILASSSSTPARANAARNCIGHLALSLRRLSDSSDALSAGRATDARAWTGAALHYQYDCWSALKYVNSSRRVSDAMAALLDLTALTSNALSMIAALQRYGPDLSLWAPPQTERDGYWGDPPAGSALQSGSSAPASIFPTARPPNATVCKIGSCDYQTVMEAVDAAPDLGSDRFVIHIKAGVYEETVRVPFEKTNLVFVGDGMGTTVITSSRNVGQNQGVVTTYDSATVAVLGDGFAARDLTFENSAGPGSHQAVAFRCDSDRSVLESVEFRGHQDTLYAHSLRQLYRRCRISGTLDFIFGNSAAVFDRCSIEVVPRAEGPAKAGSNPVAAHGRTDPAQATGFVFNGCSINGSADYLAAYRRKPGAHRAYLGRPWKEYSRTVYVNCYMGEVVMPEGWLPWKGDFALSTLFYGEYGSRGPGANPATRVKWSFQIPEEHVALYSLENFIQGNEWVPSEQ